MFTERRAENAPNLGKELDIHGHKAKRTPGYLEAKRPFPRHILNLSKVNEKERNLKPARVKRTATYKGTTVRLSAGFSADTLQARREQNGILETLKDKNCHPRILYPARL